MTIAVVGAGVGRTGTHSLKVALEQLLGGRCHHMSEIFPSPEQQEGWTAAVKADGQGVDWATLLADYSAIVDWPGAAFWPELHAAFPDALVLLSTRDAERWYRSASNTIFIGTQDAADGGNTWMQTFIDALGHRFCDRFDDKDAMIAAFHRHNDAVRAAVPAEQLLEWTAADGWEPICERLGLPVPSEPFPVTNTEDQFRSMLGLDPVEG